ncbi:hypothetical protein KO493_00115 [Tamlana agarivorans]|uniref:Uncharacterized protein n=1 Tax=Pseudotamlana agarivorans TaxID=481183 RepID=A0ACC5U475_9FLAO|nr:hypothetical protein [Tamlana agarivorans]MBU2949102.1 hypothetical protein [Tamlana agarivorans]
MNYSKTLIIILVFFVSMTHAVSYSNIQVVSFTEISLTLVSQDKSRSEAFKRRFNNIQKTFAIQQGLFSSGKISNSKYLRQLKKLRKKELKLFKAVKRYEFKADEITAYNFWYRGILKFPTNIELELLKRAKKV